MGIQSIGKCEFALTPLNEKAYAFHSIFKGTDGTEQSKKTVHFYYGNPQTGIVSDVFTKNATCGSWRFSGGDIKEAKRTVTHLSNVEKLGPVVAVFDFKDGNKGYLEQQPIVESENAVAEFLSKPLKESAEDKAKAVHKLVKTSLNTEFILCEGSLKADILNIMHFQDREIEFLNSPSGSTHFCQCAEYFMNAMKQGQIPTSSAAQLQPEHYFKGIVDRNSVFKPQTRSITYYPSMYKDIYSKDSPYASSLMPIFSVEGGYNSKTSITTLHVTRRP